MTDERMVAQRDGEGTMRKPNIAKLQAQCDRWNAKVNIGASVEYESVKNDGNWKPHRTRSEAFVLSGHTAVLFLTDKSGCVALDHCRLPT